MVRRKRAFEWLVVLAVFATLLAAGGGGASTGGGASSEPIRVGAIFDLTGATADVGTPYARGQIAFIDWKNEQGGINGRRLQLFSEDYAYQVPRAEELYTKFVTQDKVLVFSGWGTGDTEALRPKITEDKIPFISASYSATLANPAETPYNFLVAPTYSDQLIIAMKWAIEDWKAKGNSGLPKFGYLINDSPFGRSPLADGTAFATSQGIETPLEVPSPRGATDLTPQLTQLRDYGANYIFLQNVSSPAALAIKNAKSLGYDVQFVCLNWCANEILIKLAGADAEGVVGAVPFNHESEGGKIALEYAKAKNIDYGGADSTFVQGWTAMSILIAGVEKVVADGKELTGENVKAALETMGQIDTKGVTLPVQFSSTDHAGVKSLKMFRVENGKWVPITDFISAR
ncbi:MAG: branched-chain amino acid ABC transporter substrate-binding protein [Chloroflexus aggregans]|uniref:Branched-chain amino acid ABC transporter substrate-binding protein n=1 Tax=Chloroflexus aggregans TaxID=152260 RepID=A0A2J6X9Z9_9CHLR|nr:MAG: branched-chain amino acid ABC transporter substrate-binding protein [Chloroflexus aggregans]